MDYELSVVTVWKVHDRATEARCQHELKNYTAEVPLVSLPSRMARLFLRERNALRRAEAAEIPRIL